MELYHKLKQTALAAELTDEQARILAELGSTSELAEGEFLIEEGASDDSLYVLLDGRLEVVKQAGMGEAVTLHILRPGDISGELSFVDRQPHTLSLRALYQCKVFGLRRDRFETLITREPRLVFEVMCAIMRSAHAILHRMNLQHMELTNYVYKQHGRY
ncbi:MAG: cyclic nucleotide-binding domain-containing protein [Gammaproteobacteria bacterium]|nr:cyclic nucleotide-binding domain-containing protein [Gammaproteobacteria bacterium]NNF59741.1 cyclic nucleotide-binding domain-containing protein [Gammaproteobacteria bacterium]